ncbi:MAG TPA: Mur ligase family protein, partial [Casimicrobiaceae bacterium]|nr:Mur ligase family protein [Casimicrobiaceae bacterium]
MNASAAFDRPADLAGWLAYLETLHPSAIALGLDRVRAVLARLDAPIACPVITVTGTNGKGSTAAMLEAMLRADGYRTGLYTSPHLMRYNERVRLDGREAGDEAMLAALNAVEGARTAGGPAVPLTYFEFGTLAALWLFARAELDVAILEVGLGGRLDAVNIVDADVAVVTSIDLDHIEYLGPTREAIGREKAGIFRALVPAVCGDADPPASLVAHSQSLGAPLTLM